MSALELINSEIKDLPEDKLEDLLKYARRLRGGVSSESRSDTLLLSEPVLSKDWLDPEEDAAWRDL